MAIDYLATAAGAGIMIALYTLLTILKLVFKKKPKHDLYHFRKIVYESGMKTKEVYESLQELEKAFKDIENVKQKDEA